MSLMSSAQSTPLSEPKNARSPILHAGLLHSTIVCRQMSRTVAYGGGSSSKQVTTNPLFLFSEQSSVISCDGVGESGPSSRVIRQNNGSATMLLKYGSLEEPSSLSTYV